MSQRIVRDSDMPVVKVQGLTGETNGDKPEEPDLAERPAVVEIGTGWTAVVNRVRPIPGVTFDASDFLRRRVFAGVLFHEAFRQQLAARRAV